MNRKGFTLIELMIVCCILAILAAIAIPHINEKDTDPEVTTQKPNKSKVTKKVTTYDISSEYVGSVLLRKFCYDNGVFIITEEGVLIQVYTEKSNISVPATCPDK